MLVPLGETARALFASREVDAEAANILVHGGWLPAEMAGVAGVTGPTAVFGPAGEFLALVATSGGRARPVAVFGDD